MPNMDWDTFQDRHYRPHLVVANLEPARNLKTGESTAVLFERLAAALGMSGNYTIKKDEAYIHAAFEIDTDAERFARVLVAKTSASERQWASRSVTLIDDAAHKKILAALRQLRLKRPRRR